MRLLIITQKLDINDPILGFFHSWLEVFSKNCEQLTIICLEKGEYHLPKNVRVLSLGKEKRLVIPALSRNPDSGSRIKHALEPHRGRGMTAGLLMKLKYSFNFWKYIWAERKNYDSVFVHMNPEYVILGFPVWKFFGKKVALWYTHKSVDFKLRIAEKLVDKIFTASKESFRLASHKLEVVGHGIDTKPFEGGINNFSGLRMLTVGRISPAKDIRTLILGVRDLKNKLGVKDLAFDIVGGYVTEDDKSYEKEMKSLVAELGLAQTINFLGERKYSELPEIYRNHNVFLHASRTGSMDKVVLEALVSGMTIFTSSESYQGFPDGIHRFKVGDSSDLASKVEFALSRDKIHDNLEARDFIRRHYGLDALVKKILAFFRLR